MMDSQKHKHPCGQQCFEDGEWSRTNPICTLKVHWARGYIETCIIITIYVDGTPTIFSFWFAIVLLSDFINWKCLFKTILRKENQNSNSHKLYISWKPKTKKVRKRVKFSSPRLHKFHIKSSKTLLVMWGLRVPLLTARAHNGSMHGSWAPKV